MKVLIILLLACTSLLGRNISNKILPDLHIKHGIPVYGKTAENCKCKDGSMLTVKLKEPVVISVANKPEKWGYFQFPSIVKTPDNTIIATWNMNEDDIEAYGKHKFESFASNTNGKSWKPAQPERVGKTLLPNGDRIEIFIPEPIKVKDIQLPELVGTGLDTDANLPYYLYRLNDLPAQCQGIFINRLKKGETEWKVERATINDPRAVRGHFKGLFPIGWWGDMHVLPDGSIIAGVYPDFFVSDDNVVDTRSGASFYRSTDGGHSWNIQGRIGYIPDLSADPKGNQRMGFSEPAFEILPDGTFLCILRTADGLGIAPMFASRSIDEGCTWSKPEAFTPFGVFPRILKLENGVVVLASGRPGVQVRFSTDGRDWSTAFEMLPYKNEDDLVSCGYTGLLPIGKNRFLIIYSDFRYKNKAKEIRKAIKVREITVKMCKN